MRYIPQSVALPNMDEKHKVSTKSTKVKQVSWDEKDTMNTKIREQAKVISHGNKHVNFGH